MVATRWELTRCRSHIERRAERRQQQGDPMSRNLILATGTFLWTAFAVDAIVHVATGFWIAPAVAGIVGVVWVAMRRMRVRRGLPEAS
jgi:Flp pilus assembly protein TadB